MSSLLRDEIARLPNMGGGLSGASVLEAQSVSFYRVSPITDAKTNTPTAWLHITVEYKWYVIHYHSEARVWVTDAKDGGNPIRVAKLTAHLRHVIKNPKPNEHPFLYPDATAEGANTSEVKATFNYWGFPSVASQDVAGTGCAIDPTYGHWCVSAAN
ncbi:MAG TPA: hypothetical protein VKE40_17395 [Gemmataceae bacterium]|nr:hypothetical protein [Gemmataceae bacterium]